MGRNFWVDSGAQGMGPSNWTAGAITPHVDITEDEQGVNVYVELPGVTEADIRLSVNNGVLTVAGEKHPHNKKEWEQSFYLAERAFGSFRRSINLPAGVDEDAAEAHFEGGVLAVRFPRRQSPAPGREIPIKSR